MAPRFGRDTEVDDLASLVITVVQKNDRDVALILFDEEPAVGGEVSGGLIRAEGVRRGTQARERRAVAAVGIGPFDDIGEAVGA